MAKNKTQVQPSSEEDDMLSMLMQNNSDDRANKTIDSSLQAPIDIRKYVEQGGSIALIPSNSKAIIVEQDDSIAIIPANSKAIIVRQEFNPELKSIVSQLQDELSSIAVINSQGSAAKANASLKKAKQVIKTLSEERKLMTSVLDEEKKRIMGYEESIIANLDKLVGVINKKITDFQEAELKKQQEEERILREKRDEELRLAQLESDRKANIQKKILDFENSVLKACAAATINDIDEKIMRLTSLKLNGDTYMEFIGEAKIMYQSCITRMNERKAELMRIAEAEYKNKAEADKIRKEQEEKAKLELEAHHKKTENSLSEIESEKQNNAANSQMNYELHLSQQEEVKGVQRRWMFDPKTIDMSVLPDEFKTFDEKKIKEAIAAGARNGDIPGIEIKQVVVNVSR